MGLLQATAAVTVGVGVAMDVPVVVAAAVMAAVAVAANYSALTSGGDQLEPATLDCAEKTVQGVAGSDYLGFGGHPVMKGDKQVEGHGALAALGNSWPTW